MILIDMNLHRKDVKFDKSIGLFGKTIAQSGYVSVQGEHFQNAICFSQGNIQYLHNGCSASVLTGIDDNYPGVGKARILINGQIVDSAIISSDHEPILLTGNSCFQGNISLEFIPFTQGARVVFSNMKVSQTPMSVIELGTLSPFVPSSVSFAKNSIINFNKSEISWKDMLSTNSTSYKFLSLDKKIKCKNLWEYMRVECGISIDDLEKLGLDGIYSMAPPEDTFNANEDEIRCAYHWLLSKTKISNVLSDHFALRYRQNALIFLALKEVRRVCKS